MTTLEQTIPGVLRSHVAESPDAAFLHFEGRTYTYGQVVAASDRVAAGLLDLGIGKGDRVAIAAANSPEWLFTYFATAKIGAILVTLHVAYREREFTFMLNQSGARVLVCDPEAGGFEFGPFFEGLRDQLPTVEKIIYVGTDDWSALANTQPDLRVLQQSHDKVDATDTAVILYTSGTTGTPKGAQLTHHGLLTCASAQATRFGQGVSDVIIGMLPFNHVGGLTCTIGSTLVSGGAVSLLPRFRPDLVADALIHTGITIFFGVPTMYTMMLDSGALNTVDCSAIRLCVVGGSNLEPALAKRVTEQFPDSIISNLYGMSETSGAVVTSLPGDSLEVISTTIGTMTGDFEARIADDDNNPLPPGETGELQIRGTCVADGYWELPNQSAETFAADGWLATGDVGTMTKDGHISLFARKKEMYLRGGFNVYPAEIENVIARHPSVAMSAVIGVPDRTFGETGYAFVVAAAGATVNPAELIDLCKRNLAKYKVPAHIEVVESLPLTPAGKIRKVALVPTTTNA